MSTLKAQYGGLGQAYVDAATELALLLMDVPPEALAAWLKAGMEHQSVKWNGEIAEADSDNMEAELKANYESSYVSMILSLNYMDKRLNARSANQQLASRPDIICTGLLLKARGAKEPLWWNQPMVVEARNAQMDALEGNHWKEPMAQLLGLPRWPPNLEKSQSLWDG